MAMMMDIKDETYKGEQKVYECIESNLPDEIVCYYNREINGKQFDFCLMMEHMGVLVIEVKGWHLSNIIKVHNPDCIETTLYDEPVSSPKKQARSYKFALLNTFNNKYNVNPLIMDMVCYPFLSEADYKQCGLKVVSELEFTLFRDDIENPTKFAMKIAGVYQKTNQPVYDKLVGEVYKTCRLHFESSIEQQEDANIDPYSELRVYGSDIGITDIDEIIKAYFKGVKQTVFLCNKEGVQQIAQNIYSKFNSDGIYLKGRNFIINSNQENKIKNFEEYIGFFNFEVFYIENLKDCVDGNIVIENGKFSDDEIKIVSLIADKSKFNLQQYLVEHAPIEKNIVVKAGAGTGKTYSMISRISYICHQSSGANILDVKNEIAMLTFTTEAATNMKSRLKQAFMNYFVLTREKKYLEMISGIENMRISTIHSFSNLVIKDTSLPLGIGVDFATVSGNFQKQKIFDKYFNEYLKKKNDEEAMFFGTIPGSMYEFRKLLLRFSDMLYNKGYDIKDATEDVFGSPVSEIPYMKEIIQDVIIATEKEYSEYLYENNSVSLVEYMLYLNKCVNDDSFNKNLYQYKFIFIDEFQDVDDSQIVAFLEMQKKLEFKFFIVGDLKQCIYRFRGATMDAFKKMGCDSDEWRDYTLNINYRTDRRLLDKFAVLFNSLGDKKLIPYVEPGDRLVGVNENTSMGNCDLIEVYQYTKDDEKEDVVYKKLFEIIKERKSVIESSESFDKLSNAEKTIAVLVRTNYQIASILRKARNQEDIVIESDSNGDLYKLQSSIDLCKLTSALSNPRNPVYLFDLLLSNNVNIKFPVEKLVKLNEQEKMDYLVNCLDQFYLNTLGLTWAQLVFEIQSKPVLMVMRKIYDATKPWKKYSLDEAKQAHYRSNYDLVFEDLSKEGKYSYLTLDSINESLHILINMGSEKTSRSVSDGGDYVKIICTTVHKSKGLEYDTVIMPITTDSIDTMHRNGLDVTYVEGKVGYCISVDGESMANEYFYTEDELDEIEMEEARILYVALTRAINKFCWFDKTDSKGNTWGKLLEEM
ncbi:Nuclease-related domain-containing protein [Hathewaya proteolytica DSM 3090]|uniref:DNA 3'-5' helicase n=1 Tax=Hathewaya proteolytica DSM 3090 TaxID=1121331 RepID=A0A1M6LU08_9CLOT|nr:UvrD-helicase domain-containing protein [Hathewaya proteolytica]SHJ74595.1 Nuclease-related domain-containing protein [Hathewaya proteolytica DSM 3090]